MNGGKERDGEEHEEARHRVESHVDVKYEANCVLTATERSAVRDRTGKSKIPTPELMLDAARLAMALYYYSPQPTSAAIIQDRRCRERSTRTTGMITALHTVLLISDNRQKASGQTPSLNICS